MFYTYSIKCMFYHDRLLEMIGSRTPKIAVIYCRNKNFETNLENMLRGIAVRSTMVTIIRELS